MGEGLTAGRHAAVHQLTVVLPKLIRRHSKNKGVSAFVLLFHAIPTMPLTHLMLLVLRANGVLGIAT
jgi:hypothetical protein